MGKEWRSVKGGVDVKGGMWGGMKGSAWVEGWERWGWFSGGLYLFGDHSGMLS